MKFLRATALAIGAAVALHAGAATLRYDVKDLGTRPGRAAYPVAINAGGQVVGQAYEWATGDSGSFATGPQGEGMGDPCPAGTQSCLAAGIDDAGEVALFIVQADLQGNNVWRAGIVAIDGSGLTYLGNLGQDFNLVQGMSHKGKLTGDGLDAGSVFRPYLGHVPAKKVKALGTLGTGTHGMAVNDAGQVAGWSSLPDSSQHAVLALPDGSPALDLGTLGGSYSLAEAISDGGHIVGYSTTEVSGTSPLHAFLARAGTPGMTDLGHLGGGYSEAKGVNRTGVVVGMSSLASGEYVGFVQHTKGGGAMVDLNTIARMPAGVTLTEADAVNDQGQIAAYGSDFHTYLLTPR